MPPRSALLAKLAARKQLIQKSTAQAAEPTTDTAAATAAEASAPATNGATAAGPKRPVQARKQAAVARTATVAAAHTPTAAASPAAVPAAATTSEDEDASESSSSSEEESSSSSESSAYSASEDEVDAEGRRKYRIFVCPLPASCAPAHTKPSKAAATKAKTAAGAAAVTAAKDPFALPPPTPSPCAAAIQSLYAATLRERFGSFGEVVAVDVRSKVGFAPLTAGADGASTTERTIPLGMKACPDCLACPHCSAHEQFHYAFLTLHTTLAQVDSMLKAFRHSKFRGEFVRVERAKLDYRPRMLDERHKDKKRKHMLALRETKRVETQKQMGREGLPRELGSVAYEFKNPHGGNIFPLTESIPTRDFPEADKIQPLPISQLDWEERGPPDPSTIPRAPIDYELLAALFSGISSDAATVAKAAAAGAAAGAVARKKGGRKMNQKDEEDEWGALERGDTEAGKDATKDSAQEDDGESMLPATTAATDIPSDDEWAMLERGSADPPAAPAPTKAVAPSPKLAAAVPAAKTKAVAAAVAAAAKTAAAKKPSPKVVPVAAPVPEPESDEMDLDAEFAALEQGDGAEEDDDSADEEQEEEQEVEPAPAPIVPAKKATAVKPVAKQSKTAAAPVAASPALAPMKPAAKATAVAKPSPALAPSVAPAAAALGVQKLTPASSWLGSDDDEDANGSDADVASKPASSLDDAAAEDAAEEEQLTLRRAFHGAKGEEMRALERSFGGDARFKLDARFEEVDEAAAVAASLANEIPAPPISSDVARTLHPSLAALTPQELLRQQLLGEKRRALSILDQVAARPGYATLSLEELAESEAKAAKESFEHSNLPQGKSAKSLQLEAQGGTAKGKRRPDAHYTKSSFEDTMEFSSDFVPTGAASLATEGLIGGESEATPGEATMEQISSQISSSLLRWMPLTADAASAGQSIQDRIAIEAEDEELARRKKLRYWKDAPRFDPSKEPEVPAVTAVATPAAVAPAKPAADAAASKSKSKPAVAPSRLALYTPQPAPSAAIPLARDGEALFEIKTERLRNLFTQPAPAVSFSFAAQDLPLEGDKSKPAGVQSFKFNFSAAEEDETANETEEKSVAPVPVAKKGLSFSAAPSKPAAPAAVTAAAPASSAAAPVPAASSASASSSFHIPSWPEGHPSNPYKTIPAADKPKQQPQPAAPKLPQPKNPNVARASAFVKSLAAAAAVGSKRKAVPQDSSDSDDDEDASGFMRSATATPEALASKWESARAAHTHDFKSKNKSATRKSGLNALGTGMGAGAGGAAGAMQRSTTQQAMGILEQSGDYNKKQRR